MRYLLFLFCFLPTASFCQQTAIVDFLRIKAEITPHFTSKKITGSVKATFKTLVAADSVYMDGVAIKITKSALEGVPVRASNKKIWLKGPFLPNKEYTAFFAYEAHPKQTLYFTGEEVWTQGQGKYTSHWLPSLDDMNDKIEFDISIGSAPHKKVMSNGKLVSVKKTDSLSYWKFNMNQPMASYLVAFSLGNYHIQNMVSASGVPIALYILARDSAKQEPTYRHTKAIFDFLETEIAVAYPWQNYKQAPVRDFLYAGMENTTATIFSEAFVVDSIGFNDRNYVNVNAHELAHQWFGNLVTETSSTHHWLHEGFATYYAMLAERHLFGDKLYYWKLLQSAEQLEALSANGKGESLLDPKASSLTFYEKGAWALHTLRELIGDEAFKISVKKYLLKNQFKNVETSNFLDEVRTQSSINIDQWEEDWLKQTAFKAKSAYESLKKNTFINDYFRTSALRSVPFEAKKEELEKLLIFPNDYLGSEAVYQLYGLPLAESLPLYKKAFESNNLMVRQALALSLEEVPVELMPLYESLLDDPSYITREAALPSLWRYFPEKRSYYLDKMEGVVGFQNKNIRQLWLVLALNTKNYRQEQQQAYLVELREYTSSQYSFEVRQLAFEFINELQLFDRATLKNVVNASVHHNWRFRNFARTILDGLLEKGTYRGQLAKLLPQLSETEKSYLNQKLANK